MKTDPYCKGKKQEFVEHKYRDGFILWNWDLLKWDYFAESIKDRNLEITA